MPALPPDVEYLSLEEEKALQAVKAERRELQQRRRLRRALHEQVLSPEAERQTIGAQLRAFLKSHPEWEEKVEPAVRKRFLEEDPGSVTLGPEPA